MQKQRIYSVKTNTLNDQDRLDIARLLIKAGYAVRIGKERKDPTKKNTTNIKFIEYWEENDE